MWKIHQEKIENHETLAKKHRFFWFPVEDINISDIIYKIQKFLGTQWASIITTSPINLLIAGPLACYLDPFPCKLHLFDSGLLQNPCASSLLDQDVQELLVSNSCRHEDLDTCVSRIYKKGRVTWVTIAVGGFP